MKNDKPNTFASKFLVFTDALKGGSLRMLKWVAVLVLIGLVSINLPAIIDGIKGAGGAADDIVDTLGDEIKKATVDCDDLSDELTTDYECSHDPSCTMSRDELAQMKERETTYEQHCRL